MQKLILLLPLILSCSGCTGTRVVVKTAVPIGDNTVPVSVEIERKVALKPVVDVKADVQLSVYFAYNSAILLPDAILSLDGIVANKATFIHVVGNCDERGTAEYNLALGQRRADAVKKYLVKRGMVTTAIDCVSYGKEKPLALGHDETSWRLNRRVDVAED